MIAFYTHKLRLTLAVCSFAMPALAARLAGMFRVNQVNRHAAEFSFIDNHFLKLIEAPSADLCSLVFMEPFLNPRSDTLQVFKGNAACCAFSQRNNGFADAV